MVPVVQAGVGGPASKCIWLLDAPVPEYHCQKPLDVMLVVVLQKAMAVHSG